MPPAAKCSRASSCIRCILLLFPNHSGFRSVAALSKVLMGLLAVFEDFTLLLDPPDNEGLRPFQQRVPTSGLPPLRSEALRPSK